MHENPVPLEQKPHPVDRPKFLVGARVHAQKKLRLLLLPGFALADDEGFCLPVLELQRRAFQLATHLGDPVQDGHVQLMHLLHGKRLVGKNQGVHSSHFSGFMVKGSGELMVKVYRIPALLPYALISRLACTDSRLKSRTTGTSRLCLSWRIRAMMSSPIRSRASHTWCTWP